MSRLDREWVSAVEAAGMLGVQRAAVRRMAERMGWPVREDLRNGSRAFVYPRSVVEDAMLERSAGVRVRRELACQQEARTPAAAEATTTLVPFCYEGQGFLVELAESVQHEGKTWFTRRAIGEWLGFADPLKAIDNILDRDEWILSRSTHLVARCVDGKIRQVSVVDLPGLFAIANIAKTEMAHSRRLEALSLLGALLEQGPAQTLGAPALPRALPMPPAIAGLLPLPSKTKDRVSEREECVLAFLRSREERGHRDETFLEDWNAQHERRVTRRTLYRWLALYREHGVDGLVPLYGEKLKGSRTPAELEDVFERAYLAGLSGTQAFARAQAHAAERGLSCPAYETFRRLVHARDLKWKRTVAERQRLADARTQELAARLSAARAESAALKRFRHNDNSQLALI